MIIKAKPLKVKYLIFISNIINWILRRKFKKIVIHSIPSINRNSSFIFMANHFSFLDGFIAAYLIRKELYVRVPLKGLYIMVLEKQLQKNKWITRFGGFSVSPGTDTVQESLAYAAEILSEPGNVLLFYPQGKIESNHTAYIQIKNGIADIISRINGDCQMIWSSNLIDYYEGIKPSLYCRLLDCGTNKEFDLNQFRKQVNEHHLLSIQKQIRYSKATNS